MSASEVAFLTVSWRRDGRLRTVLLTLVLVVSEHYADDLEVDLEAAMMQDFNAELQDDSPRQVQWHDTSHQLCSDLQFLLAVLPLSTGCVACLHRCP